MRLTVLLSLVFAAVSGFVFLPWTLTDARTQITVEGNRATSDDQVRGTLVSALGKPLYKLNPKELEKLVCTLPTVRYAFVRRHALPSPGLTVAVLEEFPWASFCNSPDGDPQAVISQTGRLIPLNDFPQVSKPQLRICGNNPFVFKPAEVATWDEAVRLIAEQVGQPVSVVDLRDPTKIIVYCGDLELHVGQADSTLPRRLKRLSSVLPAALALKDKLKYIDLSLDSNIPLKVERSALANGRDSELLHDAVKAMAAN